MVSARRNRGPKVSSSSSKARARPTTSDAEPSRDGEGRRVSEVDQGQKRAAHRLRVRRTEQLGILSLVIVLSLVGFAFQVLWVVAIVLMALLWGYMAAELGSSRRGGAISNVVTAIADEAKELNKNLSNGATAVDKEPTTASTTAGLGTPSDGSELDKSNVDGNVEAGRPSHGERDATKKELYEEAREAGIEGRSSMSKDDLKKALGE